MDMSTSIQVLMQLAGQEAAAGRFDEIAPEHLLLALLKLAEFPTEKLDGIVPGAEVLGQLVQEVQSLRDELAGRGVDSTQARRRLRSELGRGSCEPRPGPMHRSDAARRAFDEAARLAHEEHATAMTAVYLLKVLCASPTPVMVKVLGEAAKSAGECETPVLDRYGRDLNGLAKEGKLSTVQDRQAETKALLGFLATVDRSGAFLITDSDEVARDIVIAAAVEISGGKAAPCLRNLRILDASDSCRTDTAEGLTRLQGMLEEAAGSSSIALLLPAITDLPREANVWIAALRTSIEERQARIICRVSVEAYEALLVGDSIWKRLVQPIWLRERVGDEMPREL